MMAADRDHVDVVKLLLKYGADASLVSSTKDTALSLAKDPAIIKLLRAATGAPADAAAAAAGAADARK